jgi:hypothetical protein
MSGMTKEDVKDALERVLTWPRERQEHAVRVLREMEEQYASSYRLTDDQVEEVERRLADDDVNSLTLDEVRLRLAQRRR